MMSEKVYVTKNNQFNEVLYAYPSMELARRSPEWRTRPNEAGLSADSIQPLIVRTEEDIERLEETDS